MKEGDEDQPSTDRAKHDPHAARPPQELIRHHQGVAENAPVVPKPRIGTHGTTWEARERATWLTKQINYFGGP